MTKRFPSGTVSGPKYVPPHSSEPTVEGISISGGLLMKESLVLVPLTITPGSPSRHCTVSPSVAITRLTRIFLVFGRSPAAATRFCTPRTMTLLERSEEHTSELQSRGHL